MYIEDYFDIVNTGERLYSVILDEDELRMFDEISSEEEEAPTSSKKKKALKGAAIGAAGAAGAAAGAVGANYLGNKIAEKIVKKDWLKNGGVNTAGTKYTAKEAQAMAKKGSESLKGMVQADYLKRYGKRISRGNIAGAAALGLGAAYGAHKLLKRKKDNN